MSKNAGTATRRRRRVSGLLLLVVHLLVSATAVLADAVHEARQDPDVHVEAKGAEDCTPVHDHVFCQLCRVIGVDAVPPVRTAPACDGASPAATPAAHDATVAPTALAAAPLGARAPPLG